MEKSTLQQLKTTAIWFFIWRIGLIIISLLAVKWLPFRPRFPYYDSILSLLSPSQLIWHWANFDGVHYITIAEKGYIGTGLIQAFFPLYPIAIHFVNFIIRNSLYSGLLISNLAFFAALYYFQTLMREEKLKSIGLSMAFLLLFPTSFYFGCLYSESLFILLIILVFLFIKRKQWFYAAVIAALASSTRLVGIFLAPVVAYEFYKNSLQNRQKRSITYIKSTILLVLSLGGFLIFCGYLYKNFGDPFYFVKVQSSFGASRETDHLILFHQVVWRYIKMAITVNKSDIIYYSTMQEFILSLLVLGLFVWGLFKRIKKSYLFFSLASFFLPTLTGNLSSMPRYIMVTLPLYMLLIKIKNKVVRFIILGISLILLIINTALFLRGFWVA